MGAIPIYLITKHTLNDELSALFISASYLLNPLLQGINWYDFHTQAFFPLFVLSAIYFLKKRRFLSYLFFLVLSLSTIEQAAYFIIFYIPYCLWDMRGEIKKNIESELNLKKLLRCFLIPLTTFLVVIIWFILSSRVKYNINPNPPPEIKAVRGFKFLEISDIAEIPGKFISDPNLAFKAFQFEMPKKIFYIILTFAPSCFLSLLSPLAFLPCLLWLILSSLSNWGPYYSLGFQYTAFTLPFVSIATIETLQKLYFKESIIGKIFIRRISMIILLAGVILSTFLSPLSFIHKVGDYSYFRDYGISIPSIMNEQVRKIFEKIPTESAILTTQTIFPHFSTNINAYTIPPINHPSQRLFLSTIEYFKSNVNFDYILITSFWNKKDAELIYNEFIKSSNNYGLYIKAPGLELYRKGYKGPSENLALIFSYRELFSSYSIIIDDPTSLAGKIFMLKASSDSGRTAWNGPYIRLLPGNYTVNFKIKFDSIRDGRMIELYANSKDKGKICSRIIYGKDISKAFEWHIFSISFNIEEIICDVEFPGLVDKGVSVFLDYIEVIPS
jgi:uncharacterized membrane protein